MHVAKGIRFGRISRLSHKLYENQAFSTRRRSQSKNLGEGTWEKARMVQVRRLSFCPLNSKIVNIKPAGWAGTSDPLTQQNTIIYIILKHDVTYFNCRTRGGRTLHAIKTKKYASTARGREGKNAPFCPPTHAKGAGWRSEKTDDTHVHAPQALTSRLKFGCGPGRRQISKASFDEFWHP